MERLSLPNFLGIGAQRSGTTFLHTHLQAHPQVYLPTRRKEVHYFDKFYDRGIDWYRAFFPSETDAIDYTCIGEFSPAYLANEIVPARIRAQLPDCRFIVSLRNPADRTYSAYSLNVRDKGERRSFKEFLDHDPRVFGVSLYAQHLKRYFDNFPRSSFLISIFEEMIQNPIDSLKRVSEFLEIDPSFYTTEYAINTVNEAYQVRFSGSYAVARRAGGFLQKVDMDWAVNMAKSLGIKRFFGRRPRLPDIDPTERAELLNRFQEDIAELEQLLDVDLSNWSAVTNKVMDSCNG